MSDDPGGRLTITPHMSYGQLRKYSASLNVSIASAVNIGHGLAGLYDDATNSIVIERNMTYTQKRCTLVHELVHWSRGDSFKDHVLHAKAERKARRDTALMLIDPVEYASAELLCEGNEFAIADELDVTPQVVRDYQSFLVDKPGLKNLCSTH
jgi:antirestriction protein ArdC